MFSYQSTAANKNSAFFRKCQVFFSTTKPVVNELLEGLAIDVDKELQTLVMCPRGAKATEKPAKR